VSVNDRYPTPPADVAGDRNFWDDLHMATLNLYPRIAAGRRHSAGITAYGSVLTAGRPHSEERRVSISPAGPTCPSTHRITSTPSPRLSTGDPRNAAATPPRMRDVQNLPVR
jgi:hypothetical protein